MLTLDLTAKNLPLMVKNISEKNSIPPKIISMGNTQQSEDIHKFSIAWRWLTLGLYTTDRLLGEKMLPPFYFIPAFLCKSWDFWNGSLNLEQNLLHRYSSSRKTHFSCSVGAIQSRRDWSESASSFCGGLEVKLWITKQQEDQCSVHQGLERKPWWSIPLFIQNRDFPSSFLHTRRRVFHCPSRTADGCMQLGTRTGSFPSLLCHKSTQWTSRNMINSWIFPRASYILPYLIEQQLPGLNSSMCLKLITASGQCLWSLEEVRPMCLHDRCAGMQVMPSWDRSTAWIMHWAWNQRRPGICFCFLHWEACPAVLLLDQVLQSYSSLLVSLEVCWSKSMAPAGY